MNVDLFALASFVIVTTFTPGPNNITSASMGILYGYKNTLKYLSGITTGFFVIMLLCSMISSTLLQILPVFENLLRIIGSIYILWLAFHTFKASYSFNEERQIFLGFTQGFILQLLNPKLIIYGLTLYSTFLSDIITKPIELFISAIILAGIGLCSISTWTLFGTSIRVYLDRPQIKKLLNTALSLLLVYTAVELSGILDFMFPGAK